MRMWMCDPRILCRQHLLGEHGELHKFRHSFVRHHSIDKRIEFGQIEPMSMAARHDALATEMLARGMNHSSPYQQPNLDHLPEHQRNYKVNVDVAIVDLVHRCPNCFVRWNRLLESLSCA